MQNMSIIDIKFVFVMNSNISQSLFNYCHSLFNIAKKKLKLTFRLWSLIVDFLFS